MRVVVVASGENDWLRRVGLREADYPTLLWVEGPNAIRESHRLSALLSERGLSNRWLPLYKRPSLWQEALTKPWLQTQLASFLKETPLLVLSDAEARLKALWNTLQAQGLIQETLFLVRHYKHPLFQEGPITLPSEAVAEWMRLYEDIASDLRAAAAWQPCTLLPILA